MPDDTQNACAISDEAPFTPASDATDVIELTTSGEASISAGGDATFEGPIELRSANRSLTAGAGSYDAATGKLAVTGNVEFADPETRISGSSATYQTTTGEFRFNEADFELRSVPARGEASEIKVTQAGKLRLKDVRYTTCAVGSDDWMLTAGEIEIDRNSGMGAARNARLDFQGVPILYWPYFTYPVTDQRLSGLLLPDIGSSDQRGFELSLPYYWNMAPNYDATIVPHYMSRRGLQLGSEFRYLTPRNTGMLWGDYLSDDDKTGQDRWRFLVVTQSMLGLGWRATLDTESVSDVDYFQDLSSGQASTSQTNLERDLDFEFWNSTWGILLRFQDYQTIDNAIIDQDKPYRKLPQLAIDGTWRDSLLGLDYHLLTDSTYFFRKESLKGFRFHLLPEVSLPWNYNSFYMTPTVAVFHSRYNLEDQPAALPDDPEVTAPIYSFDTGLVLERPAGSGQQWLITLEPRLLYVNIPFEEQDDIPVFDTIEPDLNLVQLYRRNRFVGYDRIGDTNQLSVGLTARLLSATGGVQQLTGTIGQIRYYGSRDVTLPGEIPIDENSSDYIAELGIDLYQNWNVDLGYQWNTDQRVTTLAEARLQYRPGETSVVNLAYRYRRQELEQGDVSFSLPVGQSWNFVGRYNYSLQDNEPLDQFLGIEYETCCWRFRVIARKDVRRNTGEQDSSIAVQLELKNFTSLGNSADSLLERGILGYGYE